jgi:hypothetical protein
LGAINKIIPLAVMEALGMRYRKYYEKGERTYVIDSRKVPTYGEIKYFYAWITVAAHIIRVFNIVVVDLPPTYRLILGRDWSSMIGSYIMNDVSCMIFPNKYGVMIKVHRKPTRSFSFKKKDNELMEDYIDVGIGNYVILDIDKTKDIKREDNYFFEYWRMSFDGAFLSSRSGVGILLKIPKKVIYPHAIRLEFPCTNNEVEYEAIIQGMILAMEMNIEHLIVTRDSELIINHITQNYNIKKERTELYFKRVMN